VKVSRATDVENRLIMLARSGQLRSKVTEEQLKDLLASLAEHEQKDSAVGYVISRRKGGWDDDDDDFDL
jgi:DNA-binding TFAR19-related protein (PDSD5 family)